MRPGNCSGSYSAPPRASAIACRSSSPPREVEATTFSILILAIGTTTAVLRRPERSPQPPGERPNLNTHLNRYRPRPVTSGRTPPPLVKNPTGSGDLQRSLPAPHRGPPVPLRYHAPPPPGMVRSAASRCTASSNIIGDTRRAAYLKRHKGRAPSVFVVSSSDIRRPGKTRPNRFRPSVATSERMRDRARLLGTQVGDSRGHGGGMPLAGAHLLSSSGPFHRIVLDNHLRRVHDGRRGDVLPRCVR